MGKIGLLANPASGKDVRRLVARASVFDNQEKRAIVRRVLVGAVASGADAFVYHNDAHGIVEGALQDSGYLPMAKAVESTQMGTTLDTISAARAMQGKSAGKGGKVGRRQESGGGPGYQPSPGRQGQAAIEGRVGPRYVFKHGWGRR